MMLKYIKNLLVVCIKCTICVMFMLVANYMASGETIFIISIIFNMVHFVLFVLVAFALMGALFGIDLFKEMSPKQRRN